MTKQQIIILFLQALVKEAADEGFFMRKITLVKYLYLLDVYMAQETGQKYTDFEWIFWKFGPYANEANNLVEELKSLHLVKERVTETRYEKDLVQYEPIDNSPSRKDVWRFFPPKVLIKIFNIDLKRFTDDTYKLLDYVYFDTEPMNNVKAKDILSFTNLSKDIENAEITLKPISNTQLKKIKGLLSVKNVSKKEELFPQFSDNLLEEFDNEFFKDNQIEPLSGKVYFK